MKLKELTYWQNQKRVKLLNEFICLVKDYFGNIEWKHGLSVTVDVEKGKKLRSAINLIMSPAAEFIKDSGVASSVYWIHQQTRITIPVDLIENIFNLKDYGIPKQKPVDVIEQAIGAYNADYKASVWRTWNPWFWLEKVIKKISSFPFKVLKEVGFDSDHIAKTFGGKLLKILFPTAVTAPVVAWLIKLIISHIIHDGNKNPLGITKGIDWRGKDYFTIL